MRMRVGSTDKTAAQADKYLIIVMVVRRRFL